MKMIVAGLVLLGTVSIGGMDSYLVPNYEVFKWIVNIEIGKYGQLATRYQLHPHVEKIAAMAVAEAERMELDTAQAAKIVVDLLIDRIVEQGLDRALAEKLYSQDLRTIVHQEFIKSYLN